MGLPPWDVETRGTAFALAPRRVTTPFLATLPQERARYEREVNPRGKVPALRDAETGVTLFESLLINEYLAERQEGGPLLPADPAARARIRLWNEHQCL